MTDMGVTEARHHDGVKGSLYRRATECNKALNGENEIYMRGVWSYLRSGRQWRELNNVVIA